MKLEIERVSAQWMGDAFASDDDLSLPTRPRLLAELVAIPFADGLLFVGGEQSQVLRGRSARSVFEQLAPLLDGTRTIDEVAAVVPRLGRKHVHDVVSLLCSRGLLEDGVPCQRDAGEESAGRYLARFLDVSRVNKSRDAAFARLAATSVGVTGPEPLVELAAMALAASGFAKVLPGAEDGDVNLVISTGAERHAARAGTKALMLRLGNETTHLGPLLVPGITACPSCLDRMHPHPDGEPHPADALYWVGAAVTQLTLAISDIVVPVSPRGFLVYQRSAGEWTRAGRVAVPLPGCNACGLEGPPLAPDDPRLVPWIYHCATALPTREFVAPRAHQKHYSMGNVELARAPRPALLGMQIVELPPPMALDSPPPWTERERACDESPSLGSLATLLARTAGYTTDAAGMRRIAPTGGNLGSVNAWVIAARVAGLAPSIYHYDAPRHRLERVAECPSDELLASALRTEHVSDCTVVVTGALARCAQKYGPFCYRLVYLDSGVALSYLHAIATSLGLVAREADAIDELAVAALLRLPTTFEFPIPTAAVELGATRRIAIGLGAPAVTARPLASAETGDEILARLLQDATIAPARHAVISPSRSAPSWSTRLSLEKIVLSRRAVRRWASASPSGELLAKLTVEVAAFLEHRVAHGAPPCFVRPVLGVARDLPGLSRGLYELGDADELVQIGNFDQDALRACTNQEALAGSPAILVAVADLATAIDVRGARGYREAVQHAGAAVGHAWLVATGEGLGGTAAGAVLVGGLRAAARLDPRRSCPLLAFHFGLPLRGVELGA